MVLSFRRVTPCDEGGAPPAEAGSPRQVGILIGPRHDYLRQVFSGTTELRYMHIAGSLAALDVLPVEFSRRSTARPTCAAGRPPHHAYPLSARRAAREPRVLICRLKEKEIFSDEEGERLFSEVDCEMPEMPPLS